MAVLLAAVGVDHPAVALAPALLLLGAGAGIALPATTHTAVGSVPASRAGMASAIHNAGRQVGATLGVAVLGSIITAHAGTDRSRDAYAAGLSWALLVAAAVVAAAAATTVSAIPAARRR